MVLSIIGFVALSFATYTLVAVFGQLTGGSTGTFWQDILAVFKPVPLLVLLASNLLFAAALSLGFRFTRDAIPMAIAIGVLASFVYSLLFLGSEATLTRLAGVVLILVGIYLLR